MTKKMIKTRWHAFLDYMIALLLIISPWLFDFTQSDVSRKISLIAGAFILLMAIFSKNEGGLVRIIPMRIHLILDILLGISIYLIPLIILHDMPIVLHLIIGLLLICTGIFTKSKPEQHEIPVEIPYKNTN